MGSSRVNARAAGLPGTPRLPAYPLYRTATETYEADACLGLIQAASRREIQFSALVHGHYPGRRLPPGVLPGLKSVGYWDAVDDQKWGLAWHRNEGIELTLLERGNIYFAADGRSYMLEPDTLTLTRPWQLHRVGNPNIGAGRLHWLILDVGVRRPSQAWRWPAWLILSAADLKALTRLIRRTDQPVWKATPELKRCFQEIARTVEGGGVAGRVSRLSVRVNDLFLELLELLQQKNASAGVALSASRQTVHMFLNNLREHPEHLTEDWSVTAMADSCGLGATQFVHHVKRLTNLTPARYLGRLRLSEAARLLRERQEVSITDIALNLGFSSSQHFATTFGERFGCTPREFRARQCRTSSAERRRSTA